MPPNVVLIVFDTARADALEPYGAPRGSTPVVADLARRGIALPHVFSTANWTLPSHASMFTGLLPRTVGLEGSSTPRNAMLRQADRLLPEALRRAGYSTSAVSANVFISPRHGFDIGYDLFESVVGTRRHRPDAGLRGRMRWTVESVRARLDDGLSAAEKTIRRWLDERPAQPFFWFVNLMECHSPYLPPRPWNDLNLPGRYRAGEDARRFQSHEGLLRVCLRELDVPAGALERMRYLYRRAVASMDDWVGRILGYLDGRGLLEETLVIVTSDHGENLGEGHLLGHAISLDDRLIRVPLIAAGAGVPSPSRTAADGSEAVSSLIDLPRMIAEAVGLTDHPWHDPAVPRGVAVAQSDGFAMLTPAATQRIVEAWGLRPPASEELSVRRTCVTDGRFKLVIAGETRRLHDLATDPLELTDVGLAHPAEAARLAAVLDVVRVQEEAAKHSLTPPRTELIDEGAPSGDAESAELEERLKLLGYL